MTPAQYSVNLTENFKPEVYLPELKFSSFFFSGGEYAMRIEPDQPFEARGVITCRANNATEFMKIPVAVSALRNAFPDHKFSLFLPYIPGGRDDRVCAPGHPFTLKAYADIINSLGFDSVYTYDPHSDVTPALIDNCKPLNNYGLVSHAFDVCEPTVVVIPDGGAIKRVESLLKRLFTARAEIPVVYATKVRSVKTGVITDTKIFGNVSKERCLIIDDICDGGATFVALAKVLREQGADTVSLAVSHGIFSKGLGALRDLNHVVTTDSFPEPAPDANGPEFHVLKFEEQRMYFHAY